MDTYLYNGFTEMHHYYLSRECHFSYQINIPFTPLVIFVDPHLMQYGAIHIVSCD